MPPREKGHESTGQNPGQQALEKQSLKSVRVCMHMSKRMHVRACVYVCVFTQGEAVIYQL